MSVKIYRPSRRSLLITSTGFGCMLFPSLAAALQRSDIEALSTAAIRVRNPEGVVLVAVTTCGRRVVAVGEHGVIIYSDDGGSSWVQAEVPVDVTLTCVGFATSELGWAAGHFGAILVTNDGGATWQTQLDGIQANQLTMSAAQGATTNNNNAPAVANSMRRAGIFIQNGPAIPFLTMLILSPERLMVFGSYRMVMTSEDGGKSWEDWSLNIYEPYSENIYDATVVGSDLYIAGESGMVCRSSDGGKTFLPLTSPSDVTLYGILGALDGSIIVFGVAGTCARSVDGCKTWSAITLATESEFTVGRVLRSGAILLASETGSWFISKNNGASFTLVPRTAPMPVYDFLELPSGNVVFVGSSGAASLPSVTF